MFEKSYRDACDQLTLDTEKLEELITMTENTNKKRMPRSLKTALIAAACVAALCVTAFAAPVIRDFFSSRTIITMGDDSHTIQLSISSKIALEERDGRSILLVDEEEIDVTDAFAKEGFYEIKFNDATLHVDKDGQAVITSVGPDGSNISYSMDLTEPGAHSGVIISSDIAGEDDVQADDVLTGGEVVEYSVTVDEDGNLVSADENGNPIEVPAAQP